MINEKEELILGCDCYCSSHIFRFLHFPLIEGGKKDEDFVIYCSIPTKILYDQLIPPLNFYLYDWKQYFRFHYFNRFYYAFQNIFFPELSEKPEYWKRGITDCFDFQNKDLDKLYNYLSLLSDKKEGRLYDGLVFSDFLGIFDIVFYIDRMIPDDTCLPFVLGFAVIFQKQNLWGRIKQSLKYLFGNIQNEFNIEITPDQADSLKEFITIVRKNNDEDKNKNN